MQQLYKIKQVTTRADLLRFVNFKVKLYQSNPYCVPPLTADEMQILDPKRNPAFAFSEAAQFLCLDADGKIVGRIGAFINHKANEVWSQSHGRFGWLDFIEDPEVARLLVEAAREWLSRRGMTAMVGPLGFTDLDHEGMLVEGFDQLGTMSTLYNYSYYPQYLENMGFLPDAEWLEYKIFIPPIDSENRYSKMADIVARRNNLRILKLKTVKELRAGNWAEKFFDLINTAYTPLYGFVPLSVEQKAKYIAQYVPFLRMEFLTLVIDEKDRLVGAGLALPSLAKALQRCRGKLLPFGFISLLHALKRKKLDVADLMLVAVHPDHQNKGVNAMIFAQMLPQLQKVGVKYVESNPELHSNDKVRSLWEEFDYLQHKQRIAYIKEI